METKHTDFKRFLPTSTFVIENVSYPKEAIEHLVDQIIKLHEKGEYLMYSHQIDATISILNNMLEMISKPILIKKDGN